MGIEFRKKEEWFHFYDNGGNEIKRKTEIRFDPLTKESSRIVFDPGLSLTAPDYSEEGKATEGKNCPFCPENVLKLTPVFPKEICPEGRFTHGDALLFPNLFPYSKHNGVAIFSGDHYVRLSDFTEEMISNAFLVTKKYIEKVMEVDKAATFASINWNYLPWSGGSILHPHLHTIVSETAMNYEAKTNERALAYEKEYKENYFTSLYETEKKLGERWIGEMGNVAWLHAYAPKSHNDFIGIFPTVKSIYELTEEDIRNFAQSLQAIFKALQDQGIASFNMALSCSTNQPIHVRLIPRITVGALKTSDMNFFQTLHQEPLTYKQPEEIALLARKYF